MSGHFILQQLSFIGSIGFVLAGFTTIGIILVSFGWGMLVAGLMK